MQRGDDTAIESQEKGRFRLLQERSNLTRGQLLMWIGQALNPEAPVYSMVHTFRIHGQLDLQAFRQAWSSLGAASDALRTTVKTRAGVPHQLVLDAPIDELDYIDLSDRVDPEQSFADWLRTRRLRVLRLEERLWDTALVRLAGNTHVWYLNQHHLITDGLSFGLTFDAMQRRYALALADRLEQADELPLFADYVAHEKAFQATDKWRKAQSYWQQQSQAEVSQPSFYGSRPARKSVATEFFVLNLGEARSARLREIAASVAFKSLTPDLALTALWTTLWLATVHRIAGVRSLRLGMPFQARPTPAFKRTIGLMMEVGVLNLELEADESFVSLHAKVLRQLLSGLRHAVPGASCDEINRSYVMLLNYVTAKFGDFAGFPVETGWVHTGSGDDSQAVRIQVCDFDDSGSFAIHLEVNGDVFSDGRGQWLRGQFERLIDAFLDDPHRDLGGFDLLSEDERHLFLEAFNASEAPEHQAVDVVSLFEAQVRTTPDAKALIHGEDVLTFQALSRRANQLASYLAAECDTDHPRIAIGMPRSIDAVVAIWAVLKAGGIFVPIDAEMPSLRKRQLLADLQPDTVLVRNGANSDMDWAQGFRTLDVHRLDLDRQPDSDPLRQPEGDDLAYMIYTSGSTGMPKAAMMSHRGLANYVCWARRAYVGEETLDFALYSSLAFDLTLTSIFVPAVSGGSIRVFSDEEGRSGLEILDVFEADSVDVIKLTPAHLELVRSHGIECQRVRKLIVGGEDFKTSLARSVHDAFHGRVEIFNEYGPTEATVGCMVHRYDPVADTQASVPIGYPISDTSIYLLDEYGQPVPAGVTGEMVISSPGVAAGYWNRRELTDDRFGEDPFRSGRRIYHTGDMARWSAGGAMEFLGRVDHQVKVRGYRIELGEIDAAMLDCPGVQAAVTVVRTDPEKSQPQLVGYFTAEHPMDPEKLREQLAIRLPRHMIPSHLVALAEFPLTANGKVNHLALPDPEPNRTAMVGHYVAPSTPSEIRLAEIWRGVLGVDRVGIHDNFLALGGDSVMSIEIAAEAKRLGLAISPRNLFTSQTVAELCSGLTAGMEAVEPASAAEVPWETESFHEDVDRVRSALGPAFEKLEELYPLTPTQAGMLYHCLAASHRSLYVGQITGTLEGDIDLNALQQGYEQLVGAQPVLRTRFFWEGLEAPLQGVCRPAMPSWEVLDWSDRPEQQRERDIALLQAHLRNAGFDLGAGPPLQLTAVRVSDSEVRLIWTGHHILFDGWSTYPMISDWLARYDALVGCSERPEPSPPFRDYVAWLYRQDRQKSRAFWQGYLDGVSEGTLVPLGERDAVASSQRQSCDLWLGPLASEQLRELARRKHVTLNVLFQAAWAALLNRYTGQRNIVFGSTHSGRNGDVPGIERMAGLLINTLPVHLNVRGEMTVDAWLPEVQQRLLAIADFEHTSLSEIQQLAGFSAEQPLFDSIVVFENYPSRVAHQSSNLNLGPLTFTAPSHYPLAVLVYPGDDLKVTFVYDDARFNENVVLEIARHLQTLLEGIAADPLCRIKDLPIMPASERTRLVDDWGRSDSISADHRTLHQMIDLAAGANPVGVAVTCGDERLRYAELERQSNALAARLQERSIDRGSLVGVMAHRSPATVIAILGILKSGAAFVPVDPSSPVSRVREIVTSAGLDLVLSDGASQLDDADAVLLDIRTLSQGDGKPDLQQSPGAPDDLAYVLYTSGSTGTPKGVMVTQANIVHSTAARLHYYQESVGAFAHLSSFAFDSALAGLFWTLCDGGNLVLPERGRERDIGHLLALMADHEVSHLLALPSFYQAVLEAAGEDQLSSLAVAIVAGEVCPPELFALHQDRCPNASLYNEYGPTEATVWSHVYRFPDGFSGASVPIGKVIPDGAQYVLDEERRPVPMGIPGELVLGGKGIARGYLGRPDLTEAKFVQLSSLPGAGDETYYLTGDQVCWLPDGNLRFLGRIDQQLKIRGYRVEPGEIEATLLRHPDVSEAVVGQADSVGGSRSLVAWYETSQQLPVEDLRRLVQEKLPAFMQPDAFVALEQIPRLPNGKVDRRALSSGYLPAAAAKRACRPPETALQEDLGRIWRDLLNVEQVGLDDNFFELGGDSITALRVAARLHRMGYRVRLRDIVETGSLEKLAAAVTPAPAAAEEDGAVMPEIPRSAERHRFPLSSAQWRLWFLDQIEASAGVHNVYAAYRMRGSLDEQRLREAFTRLVNRHEILRTVFCTEDEEPWQVVLAEPRLDWATERLSSAEAAEAKIAALVRHNFDLTANPPWLARIFEAGEESLLVLIFHHTIMDGESIPLMLREVSEFYSTGAVSSAPDAMVPQYGDYARWQQARQGSAAYRQGLDFWTAELVGALPVLDFPSFKSRPPRQSFAGKTVSVRLDGSPVANIRRYAAGRGISLYNLLLAVYSVALLRYCRQSELVVGTPVGDSRYLVGAEHGLGPYLNTVGIRLRPDPLWSLHELSDYVRQKAVAASEWSEIPFEAVIAALELPRDLSRTPAFQTLFAFRRGAEDRWHLPGIDAVPEPVSRDVARTDVSCWVTEETDFIQIDLEYACELFDGRVVKRFLDHYTGYLQTLTTEPEKPWSRLPLLQDAEAVDLLRRVGPTELAGLENSVCDLVWAVADQHPERVAVASKDGRLTYAELRRRTLGVAAGLRQAGVGQGTVVGLAVPRTESVPLAILAILQAGAAYVPLDLSLPADRLRHVIADSGATFVVADTSSCPLLPGFQGRLLDLRNLESERLDVRQDVTAGDLAGGLAYLMYTSGSTGLPKGVEVGHRQVVNFLTGLRGPLGIHPGDVLAAVTTTSFDISVLELLLPLTVGAQTYVVAEDAAGDGRLLAEQLRASGATFMQATPATWRLLLEADWPGDERLRALCGGQALPLDLARSLKLRCAKVWNLYGPTETTVWSTLAEIPDDPRHVSIGLPIQNTRVYIIDEQQALVPAGVQGEIAIAGEGVAFGYHGNPSLTDERFVSDPFFPGERMYLTGDLGRWLPDGSLEHLGRLDNQLKVRGYRIEAGDVENNLATSADVLEVAVAKRQAADGDERLVAFIVSAEGAAIDPVALRSHLSERLPAYMIPQHFVTLEQLPLTPNRKVDYRRLPQLGQAEPQPGQSAAPTTAAEQKIGHAWSELLGVQAPTPSTSFFELGGHSLLVAKLASRLSRAFDCRISIGDLLTDPTIAGHAALVEKRIGSGRNAEVDRSVERRRFPLSSAQRRLWFLQQLGHSAGVYNVAVAYRMRGALDPARLEDALVALARRHEILRTLFLSEAGDPCQWVLEEPQVDWRFDVADDVDVLNDSLGALVQHEFELSARPPWFAHLFRHRDEHLLLLNFHHTLIDGESLPMLLAELCSHYVGNEVDVRAEPVQFGDFARWQSAQLSSDVYEQGLAYWRTELSAELPVLRFPSFVTRPPEQSFIGGTLALALDETLTRQVRDLARARGSTVFNVLLSAFCSVLLRYCRQQELVVGTPAGTVRHLVGAGQSLGPYINTLALRFRPEADWTFAEVLEHVSGKVRAALEHAEVPFEEIVAALALPRDFSRTPVFQTLFAFRRIDDDGWAIPGVSASLETLPQTTAQTDLCCWITEGTREISVELEYASALFETPLVENFLKHLRDYLMLAAADCNRLWMQIPLLGQAEFDALQKIGGPVSGEAPGKSIVDLIWSVADQHPTRVAVSSTHGNITYADLRQRSLRIAANLLRAGVEKGEVVGLMVSRGERLPLAILGLLQAGAAYLPLDLELPAERLRHLQSDSGIRYIVSDLSPDAAVLALTGQILHLDPLESDSQPDDAALLARYMPGHDDLAYLMYTSGSTGVPKGVEVGHRQVRNLLSAFRSLLPIESGDVFAAITTVSFDISVLELLLPLCAGARVHVVPEQSAVDGKQLALEIEQCGATFMQATPATWRMLLESGWAGSSQLHVLCGGEALPLMLAKNLRQRVRALWNVYGPTETTVWSSIAPVDENPTAIDIGSPIANTRIYVLDENLVPVPAGVEGEIVIGGDGVAFGYRGQEALTEQRFLADPFHVGERMYRTGDLGRWLPNGRLEHLGRLDTQLKIRGYRIEAGDVEYNLALSPEVSEVAVAKRAGPQGDERLVAFIVPVQGGDLDSMALRRHLRERLPAYMIPQHFVALSELPLTPNRKVDYQRLPGLERVDLRAAQAVPPRTESEKLVAGIWSDFLGIGNISVADNFMELGGHSLLTMKVAAKIAQETGVELGPQDFFGRTLGGIAAALDANMKTEKARHPPRPATSRLPWFLRKLFSRRS